MKDRRKYDAIIILGGGFNSDGKLTKLSVQRLEEGLKAYREGPAKRIITAGSTLNHAKLRRHMLIKLGRQNNLPLNKKNITIVSGTQDTIGEALATRAIARKKRYRKILLVTSDKHMRRALWIFKRVYGREYTIVGRSTPCGNLLSEEMERDHFKVVKIFFSALPKNIPQPKRLTDWYTKYKNFYHSTLKQLYEKHYRSKGKKCQAYKSVNHMQ